MINGNFKIKIILQLNGIIVEKEILKYDRITESRVDVYDKKVHY
jgi:hypothetical protein